MELKLQKGSRSRILATILFIIVAVFISRLFYLQIIQHGYYVKLANSEQLKRLTIPAKRGVIYALDGQTPVPLVMNQTVYTVFADPTMVKDDNKVIDTIRQIAGGNARPDLQTLLDKKDSRYQILATKITRTQADKIKTEDLNGIGFQEESQRVYPEGSLAAQTLGFVDFDNIGRYGVEGKLNDRLTGKDGLLQSVTDVSDVPLTIGDNNINQPAVNGENVVLSIDRNIQSKAEQSLAAGMSKIGATNGSVIVMNPQNGQVMAMANLPTYNPAEFNKVDNVNLFNNNIVSDPYEPGSVIKTLVVATGIDKGVITPTSTYVNNNYIKVADRTIWNAQEVAGHTGVRTMQDVLTYSLNTGSVTIVQRLGDGENITSGAINTVYDYFHNRFNLGKLTGIEVDNESTGGITSPTDTEGNAVRYSNMSFGQGLDVTTLQVASAFSSIINGGKYYRPTVLAGIVDKNGAFVADKQPVAAFNSVSASTSEQIRTMTNIGRKTLFGNADKPGYYTGGKTGTAQVLKNGSYTFDETVGTYVGFGGSEAMPQYVIMVKVSGANKAFHGLQDAGPIFTDISNWMLDYLKIQPKG